MTFKQKSEIVFIFINFINTLPVKPFLHSVEGEVIESLHRFQAFTYN